MSVLSLTNDNFETVAKQSPVPVLIDFWADWCGPCKMMSPVVDEIGDENEGKYAVCKVNVDEQPELAEQFEISVIPTLIVMKNGKIVAQSVGVRPKQFVLDLLEK